MNYKGILSSLFKNQGEFYDYYFQLFPQKREKVVGINLHRNDEDFNAACDGWQKFCRAVELSPYDVGKVINHYFSKVLEKSVEGKDFIYEILGEISAAIVQITIDYMQNIEREMREAHAHVYKDAFLTACKVVENGWKIVKNNLIYDFRINVMALHYKGNLIPLPPEEIGKELYVQTIIIPVNENLEGLHRVYVREAKHPNIGKYREVCLGELKNKSIWESLDKLPTMLTIANLDSAYSNQVTQYAVNLAKRLQNNKVVNTQANVFSNEPVVFSTE